MKKLLAILACVLFILSLFTACANQSLSFQETQAQELSNQSSNLYVSNLSSYVPLNQLTGGASATEYNLLNTASSGIQCGETELIQILKGATLLAAGGGGSFRLGQSILEEFKLQNPDIPIQFEVYDASQMREGEHSFSVAIMGSPTAHASAADLAKVSLMAYNETEALANRFGKNPQYALALELGGANTLIPLLCAMKYNTNVLDADLCGRAVPGLETILSSINNLPTAPFALTDSNGNSYDFIMSNPYDAVAVESSAVAILNHLQTNGGVTGYYFDQNEINANIPTGTITTCLQIGQCIEIFEAMTIEQRKATPLFEMLNQMNLGVRCATLTERASTIRDFHQEPAGGGARDKGYYYLGEEGTPGKDFFVQFNNESMAVSVLQEDGTYRCIATAPCIITMYDENTGMPLTNADLKEQFLAGNGNSLNVVLGIVEVDYKWWNNPSAVTEAWRPYWVESGYTGELVRYSFSNPA